MSQTQRDKSVSWLGFHCLISSCYSHDTLVDTLHAYIFYVTQQTDDIWWSVKKTQKPSKFTWHSGALGSLRDCKFLGLQYLPSGGRTATCKKKKNHLIYECGKDIFVEYSSFFEKESAIWSASLFIQLMKTYDDWVDKVGFDFMTWARRTASNLFFCQRFRSKKKNVETPWLNTRYRNLSWHLQKSCYISYFIFGNK